jgi:hypothetical protein
MTVAEFHIRRTRVVEFDQPPKPKRPQPPERSDGYAAAGGIAGALLGLALGPIGAMAGYFIGRAIGDTQDEAAYQQRLLEYRKRNGT